MTTVTSVLLGGSQWTHPRFAVIPTTGRECFYQAAQAIEDQVDYILVIKTRGPELVDWPHMLAYLDTSEKRNISFWWNKGLDCAAFMAKELGAATWDVAVLNDDAIVDSTWFNDLSTTLRDTKVAIASMGDVPMRTLHSKGGPLPLGQRPQGFAWMMRGELGLRADEGFGWWAGDDDMWQQGIAAGGVMVVPGRGRVNHLYPNAQMTGDLHEQSAKDMAYFVEKHGFRPW